MNVSKTTLDWTYSHESAHCVGTSDEYSYSTDTEMLKYVKPDGTLDAALSAPPNGRAKDDAAATGLCQPLIIQKFWNVTA